LEVGGFFFLRLRSVTEPTHPAYFVVVKIVIATDFFPPFPWKRTLDSLQQRRPFFFPFLDRVGAALIGVLPPPGGVVGEYGERNFPRRLGRQKRPVLLPPPACKPHTERSFPFFLVRRKIGVLAVGFARSHISSFPPPPFFFFFPLSTWANNSAGRVDRPPPSLPHLLWTRITYGIGHSFFFFFSLRFPSPPFS